MSIAPMLYLAQGHSSTRIALRGAEIRSLQCKGQEFVWPGDQTWWSYSAPLLFPVIGKLANGRIQHQGRTLHLPAHGFARELMFEVQDVGPAHAELRLHASPETLEMYPFEFDLRVRFVMREDGLDQQVSIENRGTESMPASFGFHPAFRWPARQSGRKGHRIRFTHPESPDACIVDTKGQLARRAQQLEFCDRSLLIDDALFADGAVVLNPVGSTGLEYLDQTGRLLALNWTGCKQLGLWTLPGAPFVCFEPWHGHPSPSDFSGELSEKPGGFRLQPGQAKEFQLSVTC
jgi:galactose mutarotase-like enzyme